MTSSCLNGISFGTANTETTTAALLSYNDDLVNRLLQKKSLTQAKLDEAMDELANTRNQINTLENKLVNSEAMIRSFTIVLFFSSGVLITIALILGARFHSLRRSKVTGLQRSLMLSTGTIPE